ncbi:GNAT family N-acetyltransferase [Pseudomonas sp.]|uniref:GNAT family N-acetyltransferase n=1 Tax=Pseudomonas sp. TaxID=306 RepID=UPI002584BC60|nr:GNAT family N-acetyltransferase [Pseudomonas sp.]
MTRFATHYGAYEIDSVPGQPQIAHCHSLFVKREHRGRGHGTALKAHQMNTLRELGYDYATCTTDGSNERQRAVLERAGWSLLQNIPNGRTGGITQLWGWVVKLAPGREAGF